MIGCPRVTLATSGEDLAGTPSGAGTSARQPAPPRTAGLARGRRFCVCCRTSVRSHSREAKLNAMNMPAGTCADLFAGAGGLSLGLAQAGFKIVAAVESDQDAASTFRAMHPDATMHACRLEDTSLDELRGSLALLAAGPPCQPFSSGGLRRASADERDGLPILMAAIDAIQPEAVLIENVPGLAALSRRAYLGTMLERLEALGYLAVWQLVNAADYGVPQRRRRLFVVAMRGRRFCFPAPTHGPGRRHGYVPASAVVNPERIAGEPNQCGVSYARHPDLRPSPYDGHLYNGGGRPVDVSRPSHTILASAGGNKTHWLDPEGVAPEYHAQLARGGAPRSGLVPGARRLTVKESAALQTFPLSVSFAGCRSSQYAQVGNAVPPRLARILGQALMQQLYDAAGYPESLVLERELTLFEEPHVSVDGIDAGRVQNKVAVQLA